MHEVLTPGHLKKAKLMFFFTRYPSSTLLKTYFLDVQVKWMWISVGSGTVETLMSPSPGAGLGLGPGHRWIAGLAGAHESGGSKVD